MKKERKIEMLAKKISFSEEETEDLMYWATLPVNVRLREAAKWNKEVWQYLLKDKYPERIEQTGGKQNKKLTDEDDF